MTTLPADPRNRGEKPPRYPLSVEKNPYDRVGDPEHPSVVKVDGEWFAQVCNADEFPEGYMCRYGASWAEALGKVPELMEALWRRKAALCNERHLEESEA